MNRPDIRRLPKRADPYQAQDALLKLVSQKTLKTEKIPLEECLGRVLSKDAFSNLNIPSYDKTFIDGYAINNEETKTANPAKPTAFEITGKLFPVDYPTIIEVHKGEAIYVACGAPIPKGATATVKVEETRLHESTVEVFREIHTGEGIIPLGDDLRKGQLILRKGHTLRPQDLGVLASLKMTCAEVYKKPLVSIISGGDELLKQCQTNPAAIANNYALVVAGLTSELGAAPKQMGIMPDAIEKVTEMIANALENSDFIITIGGSSVGIKDFVPDAVNALGKPGVVTQGVLLRPGAISGFGIVNGKPVIMLPGHIGSCIAGFYLFAAPLIGAFSGSNAAVLPKINAKISEDVKNGPQFRFLLVHLKRENGKFLAQPTEGGSSALTTIVNSNGYAMIPPHTELKKNSDVDVFLFNKLEMTEILP
ncbi:MAG TPA: molybdopterin molybdotransferase MoeA [Candidatus Nanoarchaeia archaeon]|nr:molybdopterin molybdotransferase MoeA [Candidatus Nanoarchaeia archaeon]